MRTYYWYLTAYLRKHGFLVLISVVLAVIVFSFFIPALVRSIDSKPVQYVGVVGDYTLDTLPLSIQQKISNGLTSIAADGRAIPDLAERWSVEDEGKMYRFVLKKNMYWQDGKALTPADLTYNFRDVEIITTPNDIVFKLPDAYVPFPTVVSQPILRQETARYFLFFSRPTLVGVGKYRVVDYKRNGQRLSQLIVESEQERLIYRFYLTEDDAIIGFKRGEVDYVPDVGTVQDLAAWPTVSIDKTLHKDRYLAVFFNNSDPMFQKNVRQALSYALAKPDAAIRATGPIGADSWAFLPGGKTYDYDLPRALERIQDGLPQQPLKMELTTTALYQTEAEAIKEQWETFGTQAEAACQQNKDVTDKNLCQNMKIEVTLRISNFPDTTNFQVLLIGQETPPDPDQYYLWHSEQSTNFSQYKNTRIDSLLERGRTTLDQTQRLAIYQEFQQFFLEDEPAIFLRYLESYDIKRK